MRELVLTAILVAGVAVYAIGHLWLLVRAFRTRLAWGLVVLFMPPAVVAFLVAHFKKSRGPLAVMGLGIVLAGGAYGANFLFESFVGFGPREKFVDVEIDGQTRRELHITLTGWDQTDYTVLRHRPDVAVLQMANADVTDETLAVLRDFKRLKELDLNDTQITDAGLKVLAELPNLASLRLRGTKITDAGFRETLLPKETLIEIDLRKTAVERATVGEWRKAKEGRKAMR